jgi:hypothetical protein
MSFLKKLFGKKEEEDSNKIGSVDIIWYANKEAVSKLTSMGAASGLNLREVVSVLMGKEGSRDDLVVSANRISLSPVRKMWCETTPIYRQKNGGIYVLFEKVNDDTCKKKGLEFLGTIKAKDYTAALCAAHGIDAKNVSV